MLSSALLEPSIQQFGRSLAQQAQQHRPLTFDHRWWTNLLLDWGTRDEPFKIQLFRFIDVLPALKTDEQFSTILREYFGNLNSLPAPFRWLLNHLTGNPLGNKISAKLIRRQFLHMANTFMAGGSVELAGPILTDLWQYPCAFSADLLGEATVSEPEADHYHRRCLETLTFLHTLATNWPSQNILERDHLGPLPRVQLSIKLSALYSQLDPLDLEGSYVGMAPRLCSLLDLAQRLPAAITFDMEQAELEPFILFAFTRIFSEPAYQAYPYAGIALQAYLTHSHKSLEMLLNWGKNRNSPFGIRLVKGAYWDSEVIRYQQRNWPVPVFQRKGDTDANYEALATTIIKHRSFIRPAFGSHNIRTLAHIQALAQSEGLPPDAYEFQMLFGMAEPFRKSLINLGHRLRLYTPIGDLLPGMSYLVRRLLENTSNESFIRRQHETADSIDHLLAAPPKAMNGDPDHLQTTETALKELNENPYEAGMYTPFINEPHTDFSIPATQQLLTEAIQQIISQLGQHHPYPVAPSVNLDGPELVSINPSDPRQVIARFSTMPPSNLEEVVQAAKSTLTSWRAVPPRKRADILFRTADCMRHMRADLTAWEILETGKPWREADADVAEAIDFLEFYGREMICLTRSNQLIQAPGEMNRRQWNPRGLAAVIAPWNFSLAIPTGLVSAALVTGNIVLFKPSERSPMMGHHLATLLSKGGLPSGILHFLPGGPELGKALVAHPAINVIAFTGSQAVGLEILRTASRVEPGQRHIPHVIAEMGGKNGIIVDETADLDEAVVGVLASATGYQGQKCSACSRVIVLEGIYKGFLERLKQASLSILIGPPQYPGHRMGPLIDERALARIRHYVEMGKRDGRCVLDRQCEGPGYFQGPVILTDLPLSHPVVQEEIFGPVVVALKASTIQEALEMANDSSCALTGGIYSRSPANIELVRRTFDVGNLYINRPITGSLVGRQPFGGHRLSGVGRKAGGEGYLEQFMVETIVSENTLRRGFAPTQ
ncbi:MAG: proline dehydrogenase family protein [Nitrospirales bacterium]